VGNIELRKGDCLELMKDIKDKSIDLVIIDPPYNIKKDTWDDIVNYEEWMKEVILELQRVLKDKGSFYMFHSEIQVISDFIVFFRDKTNFIFKQFIVWNKRFSPSNKKGFLDGYVSVDNLRNYQQMAEYCLYYTFQDETGLSKIINLCTKPSASYLKSELKKANITAREISKLFPSKTGGLTGCVSNWLTGKSFIMKWQYEKIKNHLNNKYLRREYEDLRREYEDLRREYEDLRYVFNNQKTHHSVWNYDIANKQGHITPKPIKMIENMIKHSSNESDVVLDCFAGSGTIGKACQNLNRNCIMIEREEEYCKVIKERLQLKT
jgi:site-specific DNA-methyltransferase (adenine-specific)